jgi:E3 ubiquitin-protein ligase BRE1
MQEYKREKNALETKVNQMSKTTMQLNDHLRIIDAWYNQVSDMSAVYEAYKAVF